VIASLRRLRWLPALLTLLSPAVGGEVLPLLHPCPVESPWLAGDGHDAAATEDVHAGHHAGATATKTPPAPSHDHDANGSCSCLGSCHAPGLLEVPRAPLLDVAVGAEQARPLPWRAIESAVAAQVADRLPPKTAPPIA